MSYVAVAWFFFVAGLVADWLPSSACRRCRLMQLEKEKISEGWMAL